MGPPSEFAVKSVAIPATCIDSSGCKATEGPNLSEV